MSQQPAQAFASHLINQTLSSIALLESLSIINPADASLIRQKLPSPTGPFPSFAPPSPSSSFAGLNISQSPTSWTVRHAREESIHSPPHQQQQVQAPPPQQAPAPSLPPRGKPAETRAKALWDFNGTEGDDLQFRSGDIIVIDEEVNEQWYRGRVIPNGHQVPIPRSGLFPSNYIEKLPPAQFYSSPPPPPMQQPPRQMMVPYQGSAQSYHDQKPPPGQMQMMPPHQQMQGGVVVQEQQKDSKFGKIGGQLGTAFTTGIGFGAGSAIASEAVHAIF
ncbi:uncharacterized protein I303_104728 [Kwoniella dejecticola CBS 10117]|uniref:SH3 domain-containing protein n=1 Tax=Kwoniella dejecticola CBS 10117 TaxID=1296121 RepID=A0A1A6A4H8_9TREE|nr:uncharacterized protein I303_04292 [Kwoniella dejecticola CBS 10117]OBR84966.1 hypothetical protein I303_04292 [Kwoniella dejecticola CBS 10117]